MASAPRERGLAFDIRRHLPEEFHRFLDWEAALVAYRQFENLLVPGLLQTAEYASALISGGATTDDGVLAMVWRKSSFSGGGDAGGANCVEMAIPQPGQLQIRDRKNPRSTLSVTTDFLRWVKRPT